MQCGTEAEIKDRHRQTDRERERWVVGGSTEAGGNRDREEREERGAGMRREME